MPKSRLLAFIIKELKEDLPPTVFFAVGFNLIVLTTDLILAEFEPVALESATVAKYSPIAPELPVTKTFVSLTASAVGLS